jgi:hypothetical protein
VVDPPARHPEPLDAPPLCSGFRVQGSGSRVQGLGFRVQGSGFRDQGSGSRVQGLRESVSNRGSSFTV